MTARPEMRDPRRRTARSAGLAALALLLAAGAAAGMAPGAQVGADPFGPVTTLLPVVDWFAIAVVIAGLALCAASGLARAFGMLLWMLAALWLGLHLSAHVVSWLPNTAEPGDPGPRRTAFALLATLVLLLPIIARVLGGSGGKKKAGAEPQHKPFGALVGLLVAVLFLTLLLPFVRDLPWLREHWGQARSPALADGIAANMAYLYPEAHREGLH